MRKPNVGQILKTAPPFASIILHMPRLRWNQREDSRNSSLDTHHDRVKISPLFSIPTSLPNTTRLLTLGLLALVNNAQQLCYSVSFFNYYFMNNLSHFNRLHRLKKRGHM